MPDQDYTNIEHIVIAGRFTQKPFRIADLIICLRNEPHQFVIALIELRLSVGTINAINTARLFCTIVQPGSQVAL